MSVDPMRHVCIVEDDQALRDLLAHYLETHGIKTRAIASAEALFQNLAAGLRPDLIVMDIGLPGLSGLQACQQLRRNGDHVPIILLTARNDEVDRVVGLEMGADDYVGKPYSARELLARVRAALRRGQPVTGLLAAPQTSVKIGEHTFLPEHRRLHRGQEVRVLNAIEFALLAELTAHPGVSIGRERLLSVSHVGEGTVLLRAVDAAIMRLRRMLEPDPASPRYLLTVRFQGYMFVSEADPHPS
jgi:two-component system, OmpR family, phosphate regulon response regulator OmpR